VFGKQGLELFKGKGGFARGERIKRGVNKYCSIQEMIYPGSGKNSKLQEGGRTIALPEKSAQPSKDDVTPKKGLLGPKKRSP